MHIHLERTGGGIPRVVDLDDQTLPVDETRRLRQLLADADFFAMPSRPAAGKGAADRFHYLITIADGDRVHTVEASDGAIAGGLQPILQSVLEFAKRKDG